MRILALLNEKGGVGKSTLAIQLATAQHRKGRRVVLVDADPQGTTRDWRAASPEGANLPPVVALDRPELLVSVSALAADLVVIDTPAKAERMTAGVVRIAHTALIVIQPSGADIWASAAAVALIQRKRDVGGHIDAAFVTNRAGTSNLTKQVATGQWNEYGIPLLKTAIRNRIVFAQSLTDGVSVYDLVDAAAKTEIDALTTELETLQWV
ncbi:MAG: ParA family partition ATPase [Anaerolineales bacterium]